MALTSKTHTARDLTPSCFSATDYQSITPSDTNYIADSNDNPRVTRGIQVNVAGDINVEFVDNDTPVVITVLAGVIYPYALVRVLDTDTDATGIKVLF